MFKSYTTLGKSLIRDSTFFFGRLGQDFFFFLITLYFSVKLFLQMESNIKADQSALTVQEESGTAPAPLSPEAGSP